MTPSCRRESGVQRKIYHRFTPDANNRLSPGSPGCRGVAFPRPEHPPRKANAPAGRGTVFSIASWNVRTLVEKEGEELTSLKKIQIFCCSTAEEIQHPGSWITGDTVVWFRAVSSGREPCTVVRSFLCIAERKSHSRRRCCSGAPWIVSSCVRGWWLLVDSAWIQTHCSSFGVCLWQACSVAACCIRVCTYVLKTPC